IGVIALVVSATMFVVTRATERTSAASPRHATVAEQAAPHPAAPAPQPAAAPTPVIAVQDVHPTAAVAAPPAIKPAVRRNSAPKPGSPWSQVPVKPRRDQPLDPDGTLDPYL